MPLQHRLSNTGILQTNTYFDEFTNNSKSLLFTRSSSTGGGVITIPNNASLKMDTSNFTIEFWVFPTSTTGTVDIISQAPSNQSYYIGAGTSSWFYGLSTNGTSFDLTGGVLKSFGTTPSTTRWTHIALVRNGNLFTPYVNGVADVNTTTSSSSLFNFSSVFTIGGDNNGIGGNLSNLRIVKGTSVYTSNFTPPTRPLSAIANTVLLLNVSNKGPFKDSSSNNFTLTTNTVSANTLSPFVNSPQLTANNIIGELNEVTQISSKMRVSNTGIIFVGNQFDEVTSLIPPVIPDLIFPSVASLGYGFSALAIAVNSSGLFVVVGGDNTNSFPEYNTSSDGTTWGTPTLISSTSTPLWAITVSSAGRFVAVGYDSIGAPMYTTSTNGSTWTTPARMNGSAAYADMRGVAVNGSGLFVAVGTDNTGAPLYATSTNGSTWTTPARMNGSSALYGMTAITWSSALGLFVAVGNESGTGYPVYATSTNGSTWTTPAVMNGTSLSMGMNAITVNSAGRFVAVGYLAGPLPAYSTSTNGSTWTEPAVMNGTSTICYMYGVAVNSAGRFVAVGYNSDYYQLPMYSTSTNGSTWTEPVIMNGNGSGPSNPSTMMAVAVNSSGLFVAAGSDPTGALGASYSTASS